MPGSFFTEQRAAWRRIPVDDIGYLDAEDLLALGPDEFGELIARAALNRYSGWRNPGGAWVRLLALDEPGRTVLDFGCGLGLDAAWMAAVGNRVVLADVNQASIDLAARVLAFQGQKPAGRRLIGEEWPYLAATGPPIDTFYASGVLHHIPYAADIIRRAAELVGPGGHIRAMLYGRAAWEMAGEDEDRFVRQMDAVGAYATWYDADKIHHEWGTWAELDYCEPITEDGGYVAAHLIAR